MNSKYLTMVPAVAVLLIAAGCSNDEMDGVLADSPVAAQVTADISGGQSATRVSINGTTESFEADDVIRVVAGGAESYEYTKQSDGTWEASSPYYFQDRNDVTFRGWYAVPTTAATVSADNEISINTAEQETNGDGWSLWDILATPEVTTNVSSPTVSFTGDNAFGHIMSQATFTFSAGTGVSDLSALTGYALKSLTTEATFNTLTCELTAGSTTGDISQEVSVTSGVACDPIILVPQTVTGNLVLEVTYNDMAYFAELSLPSASEGALQAGTHYVFGVTIDNTALEVTSAEIKDWTTPTTQDADATLYTGPFYVSDTESLAAAAAISGAQIIVTDNIELSSDISVTGTDVTIDLNGYNISSDYYFNVYESLTIRDESEEASGTINSAFNVNEGGELEISSCSITISGGTFTGDVTILNYINTATITISDGTFNGGVVCFSGTIEISGGTFNGDVDRYGGTLEISGGTFNGDVGCYDGGTIEITGGTFNGAVSSDGGTISISGGEFEGELSCVEDGTIEISSGTFYNYKPSDDYIAEGYQSVKTDDTPTYVIVSSSINTEADLIAAATVGGSYTMMAYITLTSNLSVTASDLTIDQNDCYISGSSYNIEVQSGASLTISDGKNGTHEIQCGINVNEGGKLIINSGAFGGEVKNEAGTVTIKDGEFNGTITFSGGVITIEGGTFNKYINCSGSTVTISGGTFNSYVDCFSSGTITITGGTYSYSPTPSSGGTIEISGGTFYNDPTYYNATIADGYLCVKTSDDPVTYIVVTWEDAVAMTGAQIILSDDTTLSSDLFVTASDLTIDLNGYYISGSYNIEVENGASLTIIEDGTGHSEIRCDVYVNEGGELTISGGTFYQELSCEGGAITIEDGTFHSSVICKGGSITIEDGTFNGSVYSYTGGSITIKDGTFKSRVTCYSGTIEISGGTFYNYHPVDDGSCTLADGYKVTDNGTYYVVEPE